MNVQMKKGVLELIVMTAISRRDMYGYEIVDTVRNIVGIGESTIYPLLKRLTNEHYFITYLKESNEGPPRKYYHITEAGSQYVHKLRLEWLSFADNVKSYLLEEDSLDQERISKPAE